MVSTLTLFLVMGETICNATNAQPVLSYVETRKDALQLKERRSGATMRDYHVR